jgi:hypothetical protein
MTTRKYRLGYRQPGIFLAVLMLFAVAPAKANTYLFSFTANDAMAALIDTNSWDVVGESAYFAVFVQPDPIQIASYSYVWAGSPNPQDANQWTTNVITDPSNPLGPGSWQQFSKTPTQSYVTVMSVANSPGYNIFLGHTYSDNVTPPYGWGSTLGNINTLMDLSARFEFMIETPLTLSGSYTIRGMASALVSDDPYNYVGVKENGQQSFELTLEPVLQTPEPASFGLVFLGALTLFYSGRRLST